MQKNLMLKLYKNVRGAVIGDLYLTVQNGEDVEQKRLLATAHPATICAGIFAMNVFDFELETKKGKKQFEFPVNERDLEELACLLSDQEYANFMSGFATFSRFDFANPAPFDNYAWIHWRTACHHLPKDLLEVVPTEPAPKSFKKELRERNRFIYHPMC